MLSTAYRLRLEEIAQRIATHQEVGLEDMIWANKLAANNQSAAKILRQARRKAANPEMTEDSLDGLLNKLDLGDPDPMNHKTTFNSPDEIAEWFTRRDDEDGRLRRD
jgi:hypothetical protein